MNVKNWVPSLGTVSGFGLCMLQGLPAMAADTPTTADSLEEIVVTGVRGSIERSLEMKKLSLGVVDGISAEDIGKFPDLNLSESLQRIPGVVVDRSEVGEGTAINVRGLGPNFTRVEINGMTGTSGITGGGPTPAVLARAFTFQSLASELFQTASVAKSPSANMVEGGLAGTVELQTPKPFSFKDFKLSATFEESRGQQAKVNDPRAFVLVSKNWNDVFGALASFSFSKDDFGTDQVSFGSWGPFSQVVDPAVAPSLPPALLNAATPRTSAYYAYTAERKNFGGTFTTQYRPSDSLVLTLDSLFTHSYGAHWDDRPDAPIEGPNQAPTSYVIQNGAVVSATFPGIQNRIGTSWRPETDRLYQVTLKAEWQAGEQWKITPFLGYSERDSSTELRLYSFAINNTNFTYNVNGDFARFSSDATDFSSNPQAYGVNIFIFNRLQNVDKESNAKVDFSRQIADQGLQSVDFGFRYARMEASTSGVAAYLLNNSPLLASAPASLASVYRLRPFYVGGAPAGVPGQILAVDTNAIQAAYYPGMDPYTAAGFTPDPVSDAASTYDIKENTTAAYVKANIGVGKLAMDAGVRIAHTEETSSGNLTVNNTVVPNTVTNKYTNFLPSANLRYELAKDLLLRATYSRAMSRPQLNDLSPSTDIQPGPKTGTRGNPQLRPYLADQVDLGAEWYFHQDALLAGTFFAKEIDSVIVQTTTNVFTTYPDQLTRQPVQGYISFTQPTNGKGARILGFEATAQSSFFFMPYFLKNFGSILNYTYANSDASFIDQTGARSTSLPSLSKHSANATLYYDDSRLDSRLAYSWRSQYLPTTAGMFGAQRWFKGFGQLDFSINYKIRPELQATFQVLNVLDAQRKEITRIPGLTIDLPTSVLELERRLFLGVRLSL